MFRVQVGDDHIEVIRILDDLRVAITGDETHLQIRDGSGTARCARAEVRRAVALVLSAMEPRWHDLLAPVIAYDTLLPERPAAFAYARLVRVLRGPLQAWAERVRPDILSAQLRIMDLLGPIDETLGGIDLHGETHLLRDLAKHRAAVFAIPLARGQDDPLAALRDWRGLYSPTGKPYRSLNRTLMSFEQGVDCETFGALRHVKLERPIVDELELAFACRCASVFARRDLLVEKAALVRRLLHFDHDEIDQILARRRARMNVDNRPSRRAEIDRLVDLLTFAPVSRANLGGLVQRAIKAREDQRYERAIETWGGWDAPTARPLWPLPDVPEVHFLATIRQLHDEGETMGHCVGSYFPDAVHGRSFFFHIEHRGDTATIAVDKDGMIEEVNGPHNEENAACRWAARFFRRHRREWRAARKNNRAPRPVHVQLGLPGLEA